MWKYKEILDHGSNELQEVVFLITQGNEPKKPTKECEEENESISEKTRQ